MNEKINKLCCKSLQTELLNKYSAKGQERVGFLLSKGLKEVTNIADDPENGFDVDPSDIIEYTSQEDCIATWHTHPDASANLSGEDFHTFKTWSDLFHLIVGKDGIKCYKYSEEKQTILEHKIDWNI